MQNVAREMNLSETAFLVRRDDGFDLRWFTPAVEVDLCGHGTLTSAHTLWDSGTLPPGEPARFHTRSGLLTCTRRGDWVEMDFPAAPAQTIPPIAGLAEALGAPLKYVGANQFDYIVEVDTEETVRALRPDFARLKTLGVRGVMVTALATTPEFDFVSRFFAPGAGIDEDPVTGSAHCCLAPYWSLVLNKREFTAYQASARGGIVKARLHGDRVILSGQAVTVFQAQLLA